jgi:hypothetical protein
MPMNSPLSFNTHGQVSWTHQNGDRYAATGTDRDGKRFRIVSQSWAYIACINIWRGSKWLIRNGRKHRISTALN